MSSLSLQGHLLSETVGASVLAAAAGWLELHFLPASSSFCWLYLCCLSATQAVLFPAGSLQTLHAAVLQDHLLPPSCQAARVRLAKVGTRIPVLDGFCFKILLDCENNICHQSRNAKLKKSSKTKQLKLTRKSISKSHCTNKTKL